MEVAAKLRNTRISARKARLIVDQVRGMAVAKAIDTLTFSTLKAAGIVLKIVESAIANAEHNEGADIDELKIKTAYVDEGATLKRFRPRAKGRGMRIFKRTCHITIVLSDNN